jgi:formate-nitrite transporter family protein
VIVEHGRKSRGKDAVGPNLTQDQHHEAEERASVVAPVVHEAIRIQGEEELGRPPSALAWSGLAAGLSMGFSFIAEALFQSHLPAASWRPLVVRLGYPLGYLIVIIGRQQLFTENTLTAIIPLLVKPNRATLVKVLRLWTVVLLANLVGAHLVAWVLGNTPVFTPELHDAMRQLATEAADVTFGAAILRGIFAGWLIAMVVWLLAAADSANVAIIVILTYIVGLAGLTHVIAGSVEVLFLVMTGVEPWGAYFTGYLIPALIGNIIGGVALVSALNHAQVISGSASKAAHR